MALSPSERETIVRWNDDHDEPLSVYTHKERKAQALIKAGAKIKRVSKIDGKTVGWSLEMPREWFKWPRPKRKASQAQREAMAKARNATGPRNSSISTGNSGDNSDG